MFVEKVNILYVNIDNKIVQHMISFFLTGTTEIVYVSGTTAPFTGIMLLDCF